MKALPKPVSTRGLAAVGLATVITLIAGLMPFVALPIPTAQASSPTAITDSPTGEVNDVAVGPDGTRYATGTFTSVGAATGGLAQISTSTGLVNRTFPPILGSVSAMTSDDSGGYFIGGTFTSVGGKPRGGLAHIFADGTVDDSWTPSISTSGPVRALTRVGSTIYIGGDFSQVNTVDRQNIAAVSASTGALLSWNPGANFQVNALAADDSALYVGGNFDTIGGQARSRLAAFDLTTQALVAGWTPQPDQAVYSLVPGGSTLYVGGGFSTIGGAARGGIAGVTTVASGVGSATAWNPSISAQVNALVLDDTTIYVGGAFTAAGGVERNRGASFRTDDTGTRLDWNPNFNDQVTSLAVTSDAVYAGGLFTQAGGTGRSFIAKVDKTVGSVAPWDASANNHVFALASTSTSVLTGGGFTHINTVDRSRLAAFDAHGRVTSWAPSLGSNGNAIAISNGVAYVVGGFTTVTGGVTRNYAVAFDTGTGAVTSWEPNLNNYAQGIYVDDSVAYLVGGFTSVGGVTRNRAAAVTTSGSGSLTDWNPNVNAEVWRVVIDDTLAYLGGNFTTVGGAARERAAAISTDGAGVLTSWDPNVNGEIWDIALTASEAYLVGGFTTVGGQTRNRSAAVSREDTGTLTNWNPNLTCTACGGFGTPTARAIEILGGTAYIGGTFTEVSGTSGFTGLAAVTTGATATIANTWIPSVAGSSSRRVNSLSLTDIGLAVGGRFSGITLGGIAYPGALATIPTIVTAPDAPSGVTAAAGDAQASIAWIPGSDGGSPVTRIDFALDDTSAVDASTTTTSSPHTITGLINGQTYVVYVRLVNAVGEGDWSTASAAFTPQAAPNPPQPVFTPPGPPQQVSAIPGSAQATVTWSPPADTGTFPIIGYVVRAQPGPQTCSTATTTCTVTGLTNGTSYTFTVTASSAAGSGPVTPRTIPQPPSGVAAEGGDSRATITWSPPTDDGGSPITGYRVTTVPTSQGCDPTGTRCTITRLANGTEYVVRVVATNAAGTSAPATTTVTPRGQASIVITGTRSRNDVRLVKVLGVVSNLDVTTVQPYVRLGRTSAFQTALTQPAVGDEGRFRWQRMTSKRITIYVEAAGAVSNRVKIAAP